MAWVAVAVAGSSLVGSYLSADAAGDAADAQAASNAQAIAEQRAARESVQKMLAPYVEAGNKSLGGQLDLLGLNGGTAQQTAIDAIKSSPMFTSLQQQGTDAILANASATGGLRGGNVQGALAQFSPQLLAQLIQQQYSQLGDITSLGQNAAAGVGNAGLRTGSSIADLLSDTGAAQAGSAIAQGQAWSGGVQNAAGMYALLSKFGQPDYSRMVTPDSTGTNGGFGWKGGVGGF